MTGGALLGAANERAGQGAREGAAEQGRAEHRGASVGQGPVRAEPRQRRARVGGGINEQGGGAAAALVRTARQPRGHALSFCRVLPVGRVGWKRSRAWGGRRERWLHPGRHAARLQPQHCGLMWACARLALSRGVLRLGLLRRVRPALPKTYRPGVLPSSGVAAGLLAGGRGGAARRRLAGASSGPSAALRMRLFSCSTAALKEGACRRQQGAGQRASRGQLAGRQGTSRQGTA